jgi:cell division protein FtsL
MIYLAMIICFILGVNYGLYIDNRNLETQDEITKIENEK